MTQAGAYALAFSLPTTPFEAFFMALIFYKLCGFRHKFNISTIIEI